MAPYKIAHSLCFLSSLFFMLLSTASCQEARRPSRYLIPTNYVGWVNIHFDIKDAPPLPIEDEHYLLKIPPSGELKTSTSMASGVAKDDYYYYDAAGNQVRRLESTGWDGGGMIWAKTYGNKNGGAYSMSFFVGTEEQLKKLGFKMEKKAGPVPSQ